MNYLDYMTFYPICKYVINDFYIFHYFSQICILFSWEYPGFFVDFVLLYESMFLYMKHIFFSKSMIE